MSSSAVRTAVMNFLETNSSEDFIDLTEEFDFLKDLLDENSIGPEDNWVGVQYLPGDEVPVGLSANNTHGTYRETGAIYIHVVAPARLGVGNALLTRSDALRDLLRGQRIGDILINSVTPTAFDNGATLQFTAGWMSGSFLVDFERQFSL